METKEYFNQVAQDWDDMRTEFFSDDLGEKALLKAGVKKGKTAADIGAGSGYLTEKLVESGLQVISIDESVKMLDVLNSKFGKKITALEGNAEQLPMENNSVNYVFANMLLHHVKNPFMAIKEFYRVLKPGGKLVITDLDKHDKEFLVIEQNDRWLGFERQDMLNWFEQSGFHQVEIDCANEQCCAHSETSSDQADLSIFLALGQKP